MSASTIALLNELARVTLTDCRVVITAGIAALDDLDAIMAVDRRAKGTRLAG